MPRGISYPFGETAIRSATRGWRRCRRSRYQANLEAVSDWLTKKPAFALHPDDLAGIDCVYKTAFYAGGPHCVPHS